MYFGPPAFLVYLSGHLRTHPLIAKRQLTQWDAFAAGKPYLVFLHTFDELEHGRNVWWRVDERFREPAPAHVNVTEVIASSALRVAASEVSSHAHFRAEAHLGRYGVADGRCLNGFSCASDVGLQLQELARVHRLAGRHLRQRLGLSAAQLGSLVVVRSRPDVTWRTDVDDGRSASRARLLAGPPFAQLAAQMKAREAGGPVIFGYRGPWWGGWGDVVWSARFRDVSSLVSERNRLPRLLETPPPAVDSLPPFNIKVSEALHTAHAERRYSAELVWMHYLRSLGLRPSFWPFCNVCRYRLGVAPPANLSIRRVHLHTCS